LDELKAQDLPKSFLIPYIDRYIDYVDITGKKSLQEMLFTF